MIQAMLGQAVVQPRMNVTTHNLDREDQKEHISLQLANRPQKNGDSVEELSQQRTKQRGSTRVKSKPSWMTQYNL